MKAAAILYASLLVLIPALTPNCALAGETSPASVGGQSTGQQMQYLFGDGKSAFTIAKKTHGDPAHIDGYVTISSGNEIVPVATSLGRRGDVLYKNGNRLWVRQSNSQFAIFYPDADSLGIPVELAGLRYTQSDFNEVSPSLESVEDWSAAYAYKGDTDLKAGNSVVVVPPRSAVPVKTNVKP